MKKWLELFLKTEGAVVERNPVFLVKLKSGEEHFCEMSREGKNVSIFQLHTGDEPKIVRNVDIKSIELVGQMDLLKEISRRGRKNRALHEDNVLLDAFHSFHSC